MFYILGKAPRNPKVLPQVVHSGPSLGYTGYRLNTDSSETFNLVGGEKGTEVTPISLGTKGFGESINIMAHTGNPLSRRTVVYIQI
jgi:hypothetical protein